jgi:hypothetical protein
MAGGDWALPGADDHAAADEPADRNLGVRSMLLGVALVWARGAGINIQKDPFWAPSQACPGSRISYPTPFLIAW